MANTERIICANCGRHRFDHYDRSGAWKLNDGSCPGFFGRDPLPDELEGVAAMENAVTPTLERDLCGNCGRWREQHYARDGSWMPGQGCSEFFGVPATGKQRERKAADLAGR